MSRPTPLNDRSSSAYAHSDSKERAHFWLPGSEATSSHELLDSALTDRMYIDAGDVVRVRVESDEFHDDEPGPPKAHEGVQQVQESRRPPYTITVCLFHMFAPSSARIDKHRISAPWRNRVWVRHHGGRMQALKQWTRAKQCSRGVETYRASWGCKGVRGLPVRSVHISGADAKRITSAHRSCFKEARNPICTIKNHWHSMLCRPGRSRTYWSEVLDPQKNTEAVL